MALIAHKLRTIRNVVAVLTLCVSVLALAAPALAQSGGVHRPGRSSQTVTFQSTSPETPRFDGTEVKVELGEDLQRAVDTHPAGTHFRIAAGVHRLQSVEPKDGNRFTGEVGAVLSGARLLDTAAFTPRDGQWVLTGQTDETDFWGSMEPGRERHAAVQDLFLDDQRANHVGSRDAVDAPGEWFYDYDANEIVMHDSPREVGALELGTAKVAFFGTSSDVVIEHLTISKYASRAQSGAVHGDYARGWTIRHNTVTDSHGVNVRIGPGFHVHNNLISNAGQLGIGGLDNHDGYQAQVIVESNEITNNHLLGYDAAWEGGSTKFVDTTSLIFQNNWVHHNIGPGPWFDIDNRDAVIRSNLVEYNTWVGIFYEISYGAKIYENISRYNGSDAVGDMGAGVYISSSSDVEVYRNAIYGNRTSVLATQGDRGVGAHGLYHVTGMYVHDNDMAEHEVSPGVRVEHGDPEFYYNNAGNRFEGNTYRINADALNFWAGVHVNLADWQAMGQDANARTLPADTTPQLPSDATPYTPAPYGAA